MILALPGVAAAQDEASGLLFRASGDTGFDAEVAGGDKAPNSRASVVTVPDGAKGGAFRQADDGYVGWNAPGNIYAQRGTLSFFWRSREAVGEAPFVIFRVGFADHSSWDMAFLRLDWNGHGFDAFVTDANLARVRVSWKMDMLPKPDAWHHIAFGWDEKTGVQLFFDGKPVAKNTTAADLDAGLDQLGFAARILSPHQTQSRYNFDRGSDADEVRVYDHMLDAAAVAELAAGREPAPAKVDADRQAWLHRFGWDRAAPPVLDAPVTSIRKVEFADAKDLKEWMFKGTDGIAETTWPGVYNQSKLPGRDDGVMNLPDWNTYVEGGKNYTLTVPAGESFNRVEIRGAAYGSLAWSEDGQRFTTLAQRPRGVVRSVDSVGERKGGTLRFTNVMQEQPIQEIWAYKVTDAPAPQGTYRLSYSIDASAATDIASLRGLNAFIAGRYPVDERSTVLALPASGRGAAGRAVRSGPAAPIVHVLIPSGFAEDKSGTPIGRPNNYGWQSNHDGLDGVLIELPALKVKADANGLIPLNIRVKDPIWPGRDMIDVSVSVRPSEARSLWLDLRDRILTDDPLYLTIASAASDFGPAALNGATVRLVFKDRDAAKAEHVADRFNQLRDNWGFLVEERTASTRQGLYRRAAADATDLLRVDPDHLEGRRYWADMGNVMEKMPPVTIAAAPAGVPEWAWLQLQDLGTVRKFVNWWIDNRQVPYGDFGGGLSDDVDLVQQWPGLALMGVDPDKLNASLKALTEAVYKHGMMENGLGVLTADELHAYEEGMNADAARLYLNWGEPRAVERMMATVKGLSRIIIPNPAGHMHFSSSWYGARKVFREGPWEWQKPLSYVVAHTPILMGQFNANPEARGLITGLASSWIAHGKQDAQGKWSFPNEINWRTDAERRGDGASAGLPLQTAWAAYRFTGDDKFLRPITGTAAGLQGGLNENPATALPESQRAAAAGRRPGRRGGGAAAEGDMFTQSAADHRAQIGLNLNRMYMMTEGHWWSDRASLPNDQLQRERLGGIGLTRNAPWPGHTVSWRFAEADGAGQVAILLPNAAREHFRVIAYNMSDRPQAAEMGTWNVTPGRWTVRTGTKPDGSDLSSGGARLDLERSASTPVSFAPGYTVLDYTLETVSDDPALRADLGIGADDLAVKGRSLTATVHSLGHAAAPGGTLLVENAAGRTIASVAVPALAAPTDNLPKTAKVRVTLPAGAATVRVAMAGQARELTMRNNRASLPGANR